MTNLQDYQTPDWFPVTGSTSFTARPYTFDYTTSTTDYNNNYELAQNNIFPPTTPRLSIDHSRAVSKSTAITGRPRPLGYTTSAYYYQPDYETAQNNIFSPSTPRLNIDNSRTVSKGPYTTGRPRPLEYTTSAHGYGPAQNNIFSPSRPRQSFNASKINQNMFRPSPKETNPSSSNAPKNEIFINTDTITELDTSAIPFKPKTNDYIEPVYEEYNEDYDEYNYIYNYETTDPPKHIDKDEYPYIYTYPTTNPPKPIDSFNIEVQVTYIF